MLNEEGLGPRSRRSPSALPLPVDGRRASSRGALPDVVEATAYFAASEALANVLKHAGAQHVAA